jgi:hypothetical protein
MCPAAESSSVTSQVTYVTGRNRKNWTGGVEPGSGRSWTDVALAETAPTALVMHMNGRLRVYAVAAGAAVFSIAAPTDADAQFDGWSIIDSGPDYDFLMNPNSLALSPGDIDSLTVHRVIINRMLVRHQEPERGRMLAWRRAAGLPVEGYDRYASTAQVLEIRCAKAYYSIWESTDFDDSGTNLGSRLNERAWRVPSGVDSVPMRAILDWACATPGSGEEQTIALQPDDARWITVTFDGRTGTQYRSSEREGRVCIEAVADRSASALAAPISNRTAGLIEWRWWVDSLVPTSRLDSKDGDDYAARVLVNFAFDSGGDRLGSWRTHRRDLASDYRAAFGHEPPPVTSVAFFTDADDTGTSALACYGALQLGRPPR